MPPPPATAAVILSGYLVRRLALAVMLAAPDALEERSFGWGGFGVATSSRQGTPSRKSGGVKVVNLSEHALAASDFAEDLRSGRRALESIDVNGVSPNPKGTVTPVKNGRAPAFVGQVGSQPETSDSP